MRYRLAVELPLEVAVGAGSYLLDLVSAAAAGGGCWLRARSRDEPVVFLLAHFDNPSDALNQLERGFEVPDLEFPRQLIQQLVADGLAEPVRRTRILPRPARVRETVSPAPALRYALN